jgi:phosphoesterase RecJ-like protein
MFETVLAFIERHQSFILTTHDSPDADGISSQMIMASILKQKGKNRRIINSDPIPETLKFMDSASIIEKWDEKKHSPLLGNYALMVLDTSEEYHIGSMRTAVKKVKEVFSFDHHEPKPKILPGLLDPTASSTAELAVELACSMGIVPDTAAAVAAYVGIIFDSGFFAYPKTGIRTFNAAIKTLEWGAQPGEAFRHMTGNGSYGAILLQKQALSNLELYSDRKLAVMTLCKEDFESTGSFFEDAESIVNIPLKARDIEISLLLKEKPTGEIRCSLRSKGKINVSKIAQAFDGGGHVTAAGFRCSIGTTMKEILAKLLAEVDLQMNAK